MKQIQPDLWETPVESPFEGLTVHAYLLTRDAGNVLFYNTGLAEELDQMAELGGVAYQYLSHLDEVGPSLQRIHERFGARLAIHEAEQQEAARFRSPDILFSRRETHLGNIEVIPTPGHSPGSTCFLVTAPSGKRYLFTEDTLYRSGEDRWSAGFIPGHTPESSRPVLAGSLRILRDLKPDIALSSAFSGESGYQAVNAGQWAGYVDGAIDRLLG